MARTRAEPVCPACGGRLGLAHRFDLHLGEALASSSCWMRSRCDSTVMVSSAMTDFMSRPFSSTRSYWRIFKPTAPLARNASRQADKVKAYLRPTGSISSPQRSSTTTAILRLVGQGTLLRRPIPGASPVARRAPSTAPGTACAWTC